MSSFQPVWGAAGVEESDFRFESDDLQDLLDYAAEIGLDDSYFVIVAVGGGGGEAGGGTGEEGSKRPRVPKETKVRDWSKLSPGKQKRYANSKQLRSVASLAYPSKNPAESVRRWYEHGGDLRAGRGMVGVREHANRQVKFTRENFVELRETASLRGAKPRGPYALFIKPGRKRPRRSSQAALSRKREKYKTERLRLGKPYRPRS